MKQLSKRVDALAKKQNSGDTVITVNWSMEKPTPEERAKMKRDGVIYIGFDDTPQDEPPTETRKNE
jgi:hypothetical protein